MINLENQIALVTGATGGIGNRIARLFHELGATVALSGTRESALQTLAQELGDRAHSFPCNLSDPQSVEALIPAVEEKLGHIDILVNNAGMTRDGLVMRMKDEDWDTIVQVNLTSAFRLCRAVTRGMMKRRYGRIINLTSIVGYTGNGGQTNYTATKAGLVGFSKSLGQELASRGITVNCVAPGFIASPMTDTLPEETKTKILGKIPLGRMGTADEIAQAVAFLAAPGSSYITGQTLHVNGGMAMY
jgi:3-oxoacyl-[acyl-carrier protein] reductase